MGSSLRLLCVCQHNRTRSVLMGALLHARSRDGDPAFLVRTGGFVADGIEPTAETVRLLGRRGLDVRNHRSHVVTGADARGADLILTAEQLHVVKIAALDADAFDKTFTLPEFVDRATPLDTGRGVAALLHEIAQDRPTGVGYLAADVGEIADPTGHPRKEWKTVLRDLDFLTSEVRRLLT